MSKFHWHKSYPTGVPHEIDPDHYSSLAELLELGFDSFAERPCMQNMGKAYTFAEIGRLSENFAAYFQNHTDLKKGDRIAVQMPNLLQYPVAMFAAIRCGLVVVNINPLYTPSEMKHQLIDSGAKAIVILENFASNLQEILHETSVETVITTEIGDLLGGVRKHLVNFVVKKIKKMVPDFSLPLAVPFNHALSQGKGSTFTKQELNGDDIAFLQYTGGTTGVSKGAMLTHRNLVANLEQVSSWLKTLLRERQEIVVTALPLYHVFALTTNCLSMFKLGAHNVLVTNPRDMKGFLKEIKSIKFTAITGVNTLFNGMLNHADFDKVDFSELKIAFGGGMALQSHVVERWNKITGSLLAEGYGLTETSPVLTINPLDGNDRVGSIGLPVSSTEIRVMNDEGVEVPFGEPGELWAKGPQVMKGYWQRDEETAASMEGEWFKTGDIAVMEEDGFTKIVDRKKEMILVSGFNVYPNEIEEVLMKHPKVFEVGVIGVPNAKSVEAVKAFVKKKDDSLTEAELREYSKEYLTAYKCPKHIEFVEELPKSNVGKILRRVLKENDLKVNSYE